ncbi:hypothetical protein BGZ65_002078 [Modicella reniformis]|uniref:RING-type E3 ubiquitin transferase n=1 Tax=Modicella reniformis TaxID=1440133 RepID=A0A9P6SNB9_9FUNG|nr:hypothetical protein BGZ65_002078 [Modicella reniformis]
MFPAATYPGLIIFILDVIAIFKVLNSNRSVTSRFLWTILLFLFPVLGLFIYILFAGRRLHQQSPSSAASPFYIEEVPDYLLDKITFSIMRDPVISIKSGISYERKTLLEHFSYGRMFDPVCGAQMPLTKDDIIPNRALKEACDDFLAKNKWAEDE